ncbi:hypothetical protein [Magnetospirillum molischianum]|uniref:Uncharacterized protein n=1 Tax=Magnetospirillum molischianum DSM 120 TaxID=1150626 RepID=H8FWH1_MAGML|nr:hypothetical protein [Magnetospirillum molischianum]CCG42709.1 hypothetical protein PHAMO_400090 [Magnetospirillum molischianum DSM 120]
MASTIGIRVYRIGVNERGNSALLPLNSNNLKTSAPKFISNFINEHAAVIKNNELERTWYFEIKMKIASEAARATFTTEHLVSRATLLIQKSRNYRR